MNNFILAVMHRNCFTVNASGVVLGEHFYNSSFKIDTGCTYSTIPLKKLLFKGEDSLLRLKTRDIRSSKEWITSYGIESIGLQHKKPITFDEMLSCEAINFRHDITDFIIDGYRLPDTSIYINYNRSGNILLGMDFLSRFDIHMGISRVTGKYTLIGVLKDQKDRQDYNYALLEHFNIVERRSEITSGLRRIFTRKG